MIPPMTPDEVRKYCKDGWDPEYVMGMMIAVGMGSEEMCWGCTGCENPLCVYKGMVVKER